MAVCYSSIKHHKLKRRVELKEKKRLEILPDRIPFSRRTSPLHKIVFTYLFGGTSVGHTYGTTKSVFFLSIPVAIRPQKVIFSVLKILA